MSPTDVLKETFGHYVTTINEFATFSGTVGRPQFWAFTIINAVVATLLTVEAALLTYLIGYNVLALIGTAYILAMLVPTLSVTIRRIRDTGLSPLWTLLCVLYPIGPFVVTALCLLPSRR